MRRGHSQALQEKISLSFVGIGPWNVYTQPAVKFKGILNQGPFINYVIRMLVQVFCDPNWTDT